MTTPAININVVTGGTARLAYSDGSAINYLTSSQKKVYEQRPASTSVPFDNGFRLCAAFNHSGGKWEKGSGSYWFGNPAGTNATYSGQIDQGPFPVPVSPSVNLQNRGLTKALQKLKNQDVHLGTFIAEGRRTTSMVANAARTIAGQVRRFRRDFPSLWLEVVQRQNRPNRNRRKCDIPGKWLELQYGWTPLLSDIHGAIQHLKKGRRKPIVTVSSSVEDEVVSVQDHSMDGGVWGYRRFKHKWVVKTYLHYGLASNPLAEVSSLGLVNPAEIAWELVPYSFVIDWFLPVGNWLSALTADVGYSFLTGGQSRKVTTTPKGQFELAYMPVNGLRFSAPSLNGKAEHFVRHCYSQSPVPGLYVKNPISGLHVANAIALLVVAFRRDRT